MKIVSALTATTCIVGAGSYGYLTREQCFYQFDQANDPLAMGQFWKAFNPFSNASISDVYRARIPLEELRPDLVENLNRGGSELIERYCSGLLGGWGFATQRYLSLRNARNSSKKDDGELYEKADILSCSFQEGTKIAEHFEVIEKTSTSVLFRGGSPSNSQDLRAMDVLMEAVVEIDNEEEVAIFSLKCVFYSGDRKGAPSPLPAWLTPLHLLYARTLAANRTAHCKR